MRPPREKELNYKKFTVGGKGAGKIKKVGLRPEILKTSPDFFVGFGSRSFFCFLFVCFCFLPGGPKDTWVVARGRKGFFRCFLVSLRRLGGVGVGVAKGEKLNPPFF